VRAVLVTGASSGIGAACAQRLAANGWRVFAGVRNAGDAPPGTDEVLLDVTDDGQIRAAAEAVGDELNALVNNAGIALAAPLEFVPIEEVRNQLEVNVVGQVAVTQAFLPALRRTRGRVVFIGSIAGKSALPFLGPYAASKHAVEAIADSLRMELRPFGLAVSLVEPGSILTPIWTRSAARADDLLERVDGRVNELYGARIAAFRRIALKRGAAGAPADAVAQVVEQALTAERPRTRYLVGRDARIRAGFEKLPDRLRDRLYERALLRG
jgi:NAD(P)-dependent dehydrogenase (short-subunit alcohol dehydrogenase family)